MHGPSRQDRVPLSLDARGLEEISIRPVSSRSLLHSPHSDFNPGPHYRKIPLLALAVWDRLNLIRPGTMLISPNALLAGKHLASLLPLLLDQARLLMF